MPLTPLQTQNFPSGSLSTPGVVTDLDSPSLHPEDDLSLPWVIDPAVTWLAYECWVECELDAGMVLHKPLPQGIATVDTLASSLILKTTSAQPPPGQRQTLSSLPGAAQSIEKNTNGVNIVSASQAHDIIQRMATSTYRFKLKGWGTRAAYPIPIPGLVSVGGIPAVPDAVQRAYNKLSGNLLGGIPLWTAQWELHYILGSCPQRGAKQPVPPNPAAAISAAAKLPVAVLLPRTPVDQRATQQQPPRTQGTPALAPFTGR